MIGVRAHRLIFAGCLALAAVSGVVWLLLRQIDPGVTWDEVTS